MMRARTSFTLSVLSAWLFVGAASAADVEQRRFYVAPFVGWTLFDNDRAPTNQQPLSDDVYFGGRAGVRMTNHLWFDLAGGYTGIKDCAGCAESWTHYSGNLMLRRASKHPIAPFASIGGGWSNANHPTAPTQQSGTVEVAGGAIVRLNETFGLRLEARDVVSLANDGRNDIVLGVGLMFGFGGGSENGSSVTVGGPDSDGDGVPDSRDYCPDTPRACEVNAHGCPLDADGDGVCDGLDECPDTPAGRVVDEDGCPVDEVEEYLETELLDTGKIRLLNVNFDFDRSTIRPDAHAALEAVGKVLTKWPGLKIEIEAYTDSRGSAAYNYALSHRRAESVRAYLLEHFQQLEPAQLTAKDFGETRPLVANTSEANMQLNRRVEFRVLNREILKRRN